jgi:hypothetical protein
MHQDIKSLLSKIDNAVQLCKNVLDCGEKIRALSPITIGIEAYAEELTKQTENRGRATRTAIQEINALNSVYKEIETNSAIAAADKAFLTEKMRSVRDMSPLFAKQNVVIRKNIETHLNSLRQDSVDFRHNVGVIKNYLKAPDRRAFYG